MWEILEKILLIMLPRLYVRKWIEMTSEADLLLVYISILLKMMFSILIFYISIILMKLWIW